MNTPDKDKLESPVIDDVNDIGEETLKELSGNRGDE